MTAFVFVLGSACEDETSTITAPSFIDIVPAVVDFGRAPISNSIRKEIIVRNTGQKTLNITGLKFRGDTNAFSLQTVPGAIPGNDKKGIILEFRPDEVGEFTATLTIESDADNNNAFAVMVRGEGIDNTLCGDCNDPPQNRCITDFDLELYDLVGECEGGECKYEKRVIPCDGRCADGACVDNEVPLLSIALMPVPTYTTDVMTVTATAMDLNGDAVTLSYEWFKNQSLVSSETTEAVASSKTTKGEEWMVTVTPNDGQVDGPKLSAWTTILNSKPVIGSVSVSPNSGNESTTFTCAPLNDSDADNDSINFTYQWTVNGVGSAFSPSIDGQLFARGDEIVCIVTPNDGEEDGLPVSSGPITIENSTPSIASVLIGPATPNELSTITATISGWMDDDGDTPVYRYQWFVNSVPTSTASRINGGFFSRGDLVQLDVTPFDGIIEGATVRSNQLTVGNTPPVVISASLSPTPAYTTDTITATVAGWFDADGDTPGYVFDWYLNSSLQSVSTNQFNGPLSRGDQVYVRVTPFDGLDRGLWVVSSTLTISNTIPSITSASLNPGAGNETTTFTCIPAGWSDADMEIEDYTYRWFINTQVSGVTTASIDGNEFNRGDDLQCEVTPTDTINSGTPRTSATVTVGNTPPTIVSVSITPGSGFEVTQFTCIGAGFDDQDGDAPGYDYQWYVGGTASVTGANIDGASFNRDQDIRCDARANDGQGGLSAYVSSISITIQNSLPTAPTATITPGNPTDADELTCSVLVASGDDDPADEPITNYSYSWTNGSMSFSGQNVAANLVNVGETWTCTVTPNDGTADGAPGSVSVGPIRQSCVAGDGKGENCASTTCSQILRDNFSVGDGTYWLDPDGAGPNAPFAAYCDMITDGGGWTLVATASLLDNERGLVDQRTGIIAGTYTTGIQGTRNENVDLISPALYSVSGDELMVIEGAHSGYWKTDENCLEGEPLGYWFGLDFIAGSYRKSCDKILGSGLNDMWSTYDLRNNWAGHSDKILLMSSEVGEPENRAFISHRNLGYLNYFSLSSGLAGGSGDEEGDQGFIVTEVGPWDSVSSRDLGACGYAAAGAQVCASVGENSGPGTLGGIPPGIHYFVRDNEPEVCSSLSFDGVDDYVEVPDSSDWTLGTSDFSMAVNLYIDTTNGRPIMIIQHYQDAANHWQWYVDSLGTLYFGTKNSGTHFEVGSSWSPQVGVWHHVAVVRSGNTLSHYVNGSLLGSHAYSASVNDMNGSVFFGRYRDVTNDDTINGNLNRLGIWLRALTFNEITTLAQTANENFPTTNLIADWRIDESTGPTTNDFSGNGHHGSINGATWSNICPADRIAPGEVGNPAVSCQAILTALPGSADGTYWIDPDGIGPNAAFQVYCDMTSDGGGWDVLFIMGTTSTGQWGGQDYTNCGSSSIHQRWGYSGAAATTYISEFGSTGDYSQPATWDLAYDEWRVGSDTQGYLMRSYSGQFNDVVVIETYSAFSNPGQNVTDAYSCVGVPCTHVPGTTANRFWNTYYFAFNQSQSQSSARCRLSGSNDPDAGFNDTEQGVLCDYHDGTSCYNVRHAVHAGYRLMARAAVLGDQRNPAASCLAILTANPSAADGTYWIDPDGSGGNTAFQVYCDMTTDGGGWTLVAQGGSLSCSSMPQSSSMRDADRCSYLGYSVVQSIAGSASSVRLHIGYNTSNFGDWSQTSISTSNLAIDALSSSSGNWHNGASTTFSNWDWNWSCSPVWATGWPNMFQACANGDGVHWLATPNNYYHDISGGGSGIRSQISATWLR